MASVTTFYRIPYFDNMDRLQSLRTTQKETDRFMFLDAQIHGMYSVFGDGVITGWEVSDNGYTDEFGISIYINPGQGIIRNTACETTSPVVLSNLPTNSTFYIYAVYAGATVSSRKPLFIYASSSSEEDAVLMSQVVTGDSSVSTIDDTVRQYVGFASFLKDELDGHKHRGTPSRVDLRYETKNDMPAARIEGFPADKIVEGKIAEERIPAFDHSNLNNTGLLTHPQIDTLIQTLPTSNMELMGEVASINLLRMIMAMKEPYNTIDRYLVNQLTYLPAVDTDIPDIDVSTAFIDDDDDCGYVVGLPIDGGESYFYTGNYSLDDTIKKIIFTSTSSIPNSDSSITIGVNTTNSTDWDDYTTIAQDQIVALTETGTNLRVGVKFVTAEADSQDDDSLFEDYVEFSFINTTGVADTFHFRIRFYEDDAFTTLHTTYYTQNSTEGWFIGDGSNTEAFPSYGEAMESGEEASLSLFPRLTDFDPGKTYYMIIDAWQGDSFVSPSSSYRFITNGDSNVCGPYGHLPYIRGFSLMFELTDGSLVQLNT